MWSTLHPVYASNVCLIASTVPILTRAQRVRVGTLWTPTTITCALSAFHPAVSVMEPMPIAPHVQTGPSCTLASACSVTTRPSIAWLARLLIWASLVLAAELGTTYRLTITHAWLVLPIVRFAPVSRSVRLAKLRTSSPSTTHAKLAPYPTAWLAPRLRYAQCAKLEHSYLQLTPASPVSQAVASVHQFHNVTNAYPVTCPTWTSATPATKNARTACTLLTCACHASLGSTKCSLLASVCLAHTTASSALMSITAPHAHQLTTCPTTNAWFVPLLTALTVSLWGPLPINALFVWAGTIWLLEPPVVTSALPVVRATAQCAATAQLVLHAKMDTTWTTKLVLNAWPGASTAHQAPAASNVFPPTTCQQTLTAASPVFKAVLPASPVQSAEPVTQDSICS